GAEDRPGQPGGAASRHATRRSVRGTGRNPAGSRGAIRDTRTGRRCDAPARSADARHGARNARRPSPPKAPQRPRPPPGPPPMKVLVTGGAGYVGSVSVEALVAAGHDVVV